MPAYGPISTRDLIRALRDAGFGEPKGGKSHRVMIRGRVSVAIPNEHGSDISTQLLHAILRQAGLYRQEWERL